MKKKHSRTLNVMFGDFCYFNRQTIYSRYTPLSIGMIAEYSKQQFHVGEIIASRRNRSRKSSIALKR